MAREPRPLPKPNINFVNVPKSGGDGIEAYQRANDKRIKGIEDLTKAVLVVALISLVGIVVAVVGLLLDQMHFNNQTYRQDSSDSQAQIRLLQDEINQIKGN
ncbi:MAG: hypothetical protein JWL85_774 [Candidatus Saccharibacteria bacterium]|nr:hypothetical protein [Candidatus Saccharibacteria bacterium]